MIDDYIKKVAEEIFKKYGFDSFSNDSIEHFIIDMIPDLLKKLS